MGVRDNTDIKILMLGWEFPPHSTGGLGVACLGLAQALADKAVSITFVLPKKINVWHNSIRLLFANVPNVSFEGVDTLLSGYVTSSEYMRRLGLTERGMYGSTLFDEVRRYALLIRAIAKREAHDVIHAHDWLSMLAGVEAKRVSGKPLVVHVHATSFDQAGGDHANPTTYAIEKYGMENADMVIAVSGYTKNIIVNKYNIDPHKVRVVHNGVFAQSEGMQSDNILALKREGFKIVLYLGRVTIQKGVDYFLKAAQRTLQFEPQTVFIVAGTGDMEEQMMREASYLGISDKVLFLNKFIQGEERTCLLRSADLFVMPSVSEPFGLVPLEALIEGHTPVIISKQSGVSEVLRNALRVDFWDTDEMANKIVAVLRHEPLAHQLTEYGREEAKGITWHKAAEKCIDIYQELLTAFAGRRVS